MKKVILGIAVGLCALSPLSADELELEDTLLLKSGSQLSGTVLKRVTEDNREYIIFRTTGGNEYKLDSKLLIKRVHEIEPAYKERLAQMDDNSATAHDEMYEWCKEQNKKLGSSALKREMDYHLRRIIELDPNDQKAMRLLGFKRFDGRLLHRDHQHSGHGYVRVAGKWVPEKFVDVLDRAQQTETLVNNSKKAFKKWARQIGRVSDAELAESLNEIVSPYSVALIYDKALKEDRDNIRSIYVNAIGQVQTSSAQNALVHFAIRDTDKRIREQAVNLLLQPQVDKSSAALKACVFLKDKERAYILRAAILIGELGELSAFTPLVEALRTTHEITPGQDPRRMNSAFNSGGTQPNTFSFGGGGQKAVKQTFENSEVHTALQRITGVHLGYDPEPWKAWYVQNHTLNRYDVSSDQ